MNNLALSMAYEAHRNQKRKGSEIPYIVHPIEVAVILIRNGATEEQITAGILHDTLEDTDITLEDLRRNFGDNVARLVEGASEPSKVNLQNRMNNIEEVSSWEERKLHTIEYLANAPEDIKLVCCADKLSNVLSMKKDFDIVGNKLWERFNADCLKQKWYYEGLVESLKNISYYDAYKEFESLVKDLFYSEEVIEYLKTLN